MSKAATLGNNRDPMAARVCSTIARSMASPWPTLT
jgi:hypothetical protein